MDEYNEHLRRLAMHDDVFVSLLLGDENTSIASALETKTAALVRVAASIAVDAAFRGALDDSCRTCHRRHRLERGDDLVVARPASAHLLDEVGVGVGVGRPFSLGRATDRPRTDVALDRRGVTDEPAVRSRASRLALARGACAGRSPVDPG
jgi:hypothetical protein